MIQFLRSLDPLRSPEGEAGEGAGAPSGGEGEGGESTPEANGDGSGSSSPEKPTYPQFHTQFPEELRGHSAFGDKSMKDIAADYVDLVSRRDRMVEIPGEDSSPEEREAFYAKIGRPEKPSGYELGKPEDWPKTFPWDQNDAKAFAEAAYRNGIPKAQAEGLYRDTVARNRKLLESLTTAQQKELSEWNEQLAGQFGDQAAAKLELADRAMEMIGSPALKERLAQAKLNRYPPLVNAFLKAWSEIGEDKIFAGAVDRDGSNMRDRVAARYPNTKFD